MRILGIVLEFELVGLHVVCRVLSVSLVVGMCVVCVRMDIVELRAACG